MIKITLPFPPSVNGLYAGKQRRYKSKKYKEWLALCQPLIPHQLDAVTLHYIYYFPDNRGRDTENYVKAVSDYLVSQGVIVDDSWKNVLDMRITPCGIDRENPRVEIIIRKAEKTSILELTENQ